MKSTARNSIFILAIYLTINPTVCTKAQDTDGSMIYSVILAANPSLTGAGEGGMLGLAYRDYYPGNGLNLNTLYLGYDTFIEAVHGGIGGYIVDPSNPSATF